MNRRLAQWVLALPALGPAVGCDRDPAPDEPASAIRFTDVTADAGIRFRHENGARGRRHLPETMGGSAAWFDADGDGDLDLFLGQSGPLPDARSQPPAENALYRNDGGRFADVTAASGDLRSTGYGQGVAAGDYDGDGRCDLYVTNYGPNALLHNRGDGGFDEVAQRLGVDDPAWSASAAFFDMDADGDLDLYVANYLVFSLTDYQRLSRSPEGFLAYPHPDQFRAARDTLYRNDGAAGFRDVTVEAGILDVDGKGLGVAAADFDQDGDLDLYVANDSTPNFLFRNEGGGRFVDWTSASNTGVNGDGQSEAGMGVAVGDVDGDARLDLFVTNLDGESNTLYVQRGALAFEDATAPRGLGVGSLPFVGFGTGFFDADLDGDRDVLIGDGHVIDNIESIQAVSRATYRERCLFYVNDGGGRFRELGAALPAALAVPRVVRAAAFADYDEDGDVDVLLAQNAADAVLLRNDSVRSGHFLSVRAVDAAGHDVPGASVRVTCGGVTRLAPAIAAYSYCASNDVRAVFGVAGTVVERVEVVFPGGRTASAADVPADRFVTLSPLGLVSTRP